MASLKNSIRLKKLKPNIYCIIVSNTQLLAKVFIRLQEFYESPYKEINRQHFTLAQFKKIYAKHKHGEFTYYTDWTGFNIPGNIVIEFFERFKDLSPKERHLKTLLVEALQSSDKFYVIGVPRLFNSDIVSHEFAHALYYTVPSFKKIMLAASRKLSKRVKKQIFIKLREIGYSRAVLFDELQAYMSTIKMKDVQGFFGKGIKKSHIIPFRRILKKFYHD